MLFSFLGSAVLHFLNKTIQSVVNFNIVTYSQASLVCSVCMFPSRTNQIKFNQLRFILPMTSHFVLVSLLDMKLPQGIYSSVL